MSHRSKVLIGLCFAVLAGAHDLSALDSRAQAVKIVSQIQRSDYEGDVENLRRLHAKMKALHFNTSDPRLLSRVHYWEAFALWRSGLNGFAQASDPKAIERDLEKAQADFETALAEDPNFVDAKAGLLSCVGNLAFLRRGNAPELKRLAAKVRLLMDESLAANPENPRLLWVIAAQLRFIPAEAGGGQAKSFAMLERGLQIARRNKSPKNDPLEPAWGEPELLMSLAGASLNQRPADVAAAETYAQQALALIPYWRTVRDNLMQRIRDAKLKQPSDGPKSLPSTRK